MEENTEKLESQQEEKKSDGKESYEWVQALVCSVLAVVVLFTFVARLIGVDGHSMLPTLQDGDRMLVLNSVLYHDYKYGDVVVLRKDTFLKDPIVKRVIATAGQTVDIDFDSGTVYVEGEPLQEDYINELTFLEEGTEFPLTSSLWATIATALATAGIPTWVRWTPAMLSAGRWWWPSRGRMRRR